jgi:hypothetical protein
MFCPRGFKFSQRKRLAATRTKIKSVLTQLQHGDIDGFDAVGYMEVTDVLIIPFMNSQPSITLVWVL